MLQIPTDVIFGVIFVLTVFDLARVRDVSHI